MLKRIHDAFKGVIFEVFTFFRRHVTISIFLMISIVTIIKFSEIPVANWCPSIISRLLLRPITGTSQFFYYELANTFAITIISSIIIYILVSYIPQRIRAKKAFLTIKKSLIQLYSAMDLIIELYKYALNITKPNNRIKQTELGEADTLLLNDKTQDLIIRSGIKSKPPNIIKYGSNFYKDIKNEIEAIDKAIELIKANISISFLDDELLRVVTCIENSRFLSMLHGINKGETALPGYRNIKLNFSVSLYEFMKQFQKLGKYDFKKMAHVISAMKDTDYDSKRESEVEKLNRSIFIMDKAQSLSKVQTVIKSLPYNNQKNLNITIGIALEMIIAFDVEENDRGLLLYAKEIVEHCIEKYENSDSMAAVLQTNLAQIELRLTGVITNKKCEILEDIIQDEDLEDAFKIGACVLLKKYDKASVIFETISGSDKNAFIQSPIYKLWEYPPEEYKKKWHHGTILFNLPSNYE